MCKFEPVVVVCNINSLLDVFCVISNSVDNLVVVGDATDVYGSKNRFFHSRMLDISISSPDVEVFKEDVSGADSKVLVNVLPDEKV